MSELRMFAVVYEYRTHPWAGKGKTRQDSAAFSVTDNAEAYRLAQAEGERRYHKRRWRVLSCVEVKPASGMPASEAHAEE